MSDRLAASCVLSLTALPASSLTLGSRVWHAAYEEKMATVFKAAPPSGWFRLEGDDVPAWSKVVEAGGEGDERKQRPPMAPSAFEALLETLTFTNGRVPPCLLYTSPSPRDKRQSRMPSSA